MRHECLEQEMEAMALQKPDEPATWHVTTAVYDMDSKSRAVQEICIKGSSLDLCIGRVKFGTRLPNRAGSPRHLHRYLYEFIYFLMKKLCAAFSHRRPSATCQTIIVLNNLFATGVKMESVLRMLDAERIISHRTCQERHPLRRRTFPAK